MQRLVQPLHALLTPLLALGLVLGAPAVSAQDDLDDELEDVEDDEDEEDLDDEEADEDEIDEGEDAAADKSGDESSDEGDDAEGAAEGDAAAAPEGETDITNLQTIYVRQGKQFLVGGRFEIAPQFMQSVNDRFTSQTGFMLSGIYHIKENMAVEASVGVFGWADLLDDTAEYKGPRLGGHYTDTTVELLNKEHLTPGDLVKLYWMTWVATADLQWSPLYGKVNVQNMLLGSFNVYMSVGAGLVGLELQNDRRSGSEEDPSVNQAFGISGIPPMALTTTIGGGIRFYFLDWLGVRFEVRDYVMAMNAPALRTSIFPTFEVRNSLMAQAGVSFIF
mgnify:CR=1 FL=1